MTVANFTFALSRLNRYSMPVTRSRTYMSDISLEDSNNTTGFLFGDEDSNSGETRTTPTNNPDSFPALLRQQGYPALVSTGFITQTSGPSNLSSPTKFGTSWCLGFPAAQAFCGGLTKTRTCLFNHLR